MTNKWHRILFTILAVLAGIVVVLLLSYIGGRSRGPLEGFFSEAGSLVTKVETKVTLEQRTIKRTNRLDWFKPYKDNPRLLLNPHEILLGAFDNESTESFENICDFEDSLGTTFPLIHIYTAWGSKPEERFPKTQVKAILEMGSLPVITWEPWLTDFEEGETPHLRKKELRDVHGLADIAKGVYDAYITEWAAEARDVKMPIFLRVGHEMNDPYRYPWGPQNNTAKEFRAAWRHIWNLFSGVGAKNVIWIWSPHPAYGFFDAYYPGDAYVDYVGTSVLNYGTVASWSQWWSFDEIFGKHYKELAKFNKPLLFTEFGCLNVGGSRPKWFAQAVSEIPVNYPKVKGLLFFHYSNDRTTTQQPLNWYIKNDTAVVHSLKREFRNWPDSVKPVSKKGTSRNS
jgi:hypothetical protein